MELVLTMLSYSLVLLVSRKCEIADLQGPFTFCFPYNAKNGW